MTWSERRTVTFLSAVLGVLCIALLIVLGMKYRENRDAEEPAVSTAVIAQDESTCTALSYYNGTATLDFRRNDKNEWIWAADDDFPLDDTHLTTLLDTLSALSPYQTLEAVENLEELGLDSPRATISAAYDSGSEFSLSFGTTASEGKYVYALHNGQQSPVYVYPADILALLNVGVHDMCLLPDFPELLEERVERVTIQGTANADGVVPRSTIDAQKDGDALIWKCSGRTVTKFQRVRDLFADLAVLDYGKCISYRPSDDAAALCGFSAPTATIWANYNTATDLEEHFQMVIGNLTLDGESRYVRVNNDPAIYSIPIETLDSILVVALSGF